MEFNLARKPWIPVVDLDGNDDAVSLIDVLRRAHELRRILAEAPAVTAALHRIVLAMAHRVYGPPSREAWKQLWKDDAFPVEPLEEYLEEYADHFDLFHPERPFLQCPDLVVCGYSTPAKLVAYRSSGNNATLFDQTLASDRSLLEPGEAARWLVTLHAYDPGGLKTPFLKEKSSERAPCNFFGCVLVEGDSLKQTLLLNMPVYNPKSEEPSMTTAEDAPAWERKPPVPQPQVRTPRGWTDLLTWPSRRVLLSRTADNMVDGVVITPGTRLRADLSDVELMAAFGRTATRVSKRGQKPFTSYGPWQAVQLEALRGVWRHSQELLLARTNVRRRPEPLEHVAGMVEQGIIPESTVYTIRVFGQQLNKKGAVVERWLEETVPAPVSLLRAEHDRAGRIIGHAVFLADEVGSALRKMERDYHAELSADPSSDLELAYWPKLTAPFAVFLSSLGEAMEERRSETPAAEVWARAVGRVARVAAIQWADGTPRRERSLLAAAEHLGNFTGRLSWLLKRFHASIAGFTAAEGAQ
ncbi:type I-E CRISPR-associated protein Cse1/CasA [Streptoalloteichus hindustanus]|uniref:CRISPR system Cascade subunit CasA n=1 Tax=Streptoalloteichus hindustanus TaxID=2017 RepID=A0A1M5LEW0_STRHI|nr:type I-E CRISPR-associated protein Cse1/CasA [Streptoalloteichus hindustanus]SHG62913.1 CRISPR system Cascade subunit CasA [Streptoalloteichus hindustanus]